METNIIHTLLNHTKEQKGKTFLFTTCQAGDGSSYCTAKTAKALDDYSRENRILLVDVSTKTINNPNLSITNKGTFTISPWNDSKNIDVLHATSTTESLEKNIQAYCEQIALATAQYNMVLLDCSTITHSPALLSFLSVADAVILVIAAGSTRKPIITTTIDKIQAHGGNIIGTILNKRKLYIPQCIYKRFF